MTVHLGVVDHIHHSAPDILPRLRIPESRLITFKSLNDADTPQRRVSTNGEGRNGFSSGADADRVYPAHRAPSDTAHRPPAGHADEAARVQLVTVELGHHPPFGALSYV